MHFYRFSNEEVAGPCLAGPPDPFSFPFLHNILSSFCFFDVECGSLRRRDMEVEGAVGEPLVMRLIFGRIGLLFF